MPLSALKSHINHRPQVTLVLAMSADGKISDTDRTVARFASTADQHHLEQRVAAADAALFGAGTLRAYGTTVLIKDPTLIEHRRQQQQQPQPIQIVCSPSGYLDAKARFFSQPVPRWLLTTASGAKAWHDKKAFERIWIAPTVGQYFYWPEILAELKTLSIDRLLVMGGGQLVAALMAADLIDQLWPTVCPLVIGGERAPTPCDGDGFSLMDAPQFTLISNTAVGDEVFLHYRRQR